MTPLSVFIITLNEESNLPRCLASLEGIADEIVVVDSNSKDSTREIAVRAGAKVVEHAWAGFVGQKNFAIEQCTHDWALSIDADEEISPELRASLLKLKAELNSPPAPGEPFAYAMPRRVWYIDRWIWHGDWYPDYVIRLFYRPECRFQGGAVHESLHFPGDVGRMTGDLLHYTYKDRADHLQRVKHYSGLWASGQRAAGKRAGPLAPYGRALFRFIRFYLLRRGFLDGRRGLQIASICSYEVWLKYSQLRSKSSG